METRIAKSILNEVNMPKSVKEMIEKIIYHCPECETENILFCFEELPQDFRNVFKERRKRHPAICPVVGFCPDCREYSTCSIGIEH